jgi:hypothetical protein
VYQGESLEAEPILEWIKESITPENIKANRDDINYNDGVVRDSKVYKVLGQEKLVTEKNYISKIFKN